MFRLTLLPHRGGDISRTSLYPPPFSLLVAAILPLLPPCLLTGSEMRAECTQPSLKTLATRLRLRPFPKEIDSSLPGGKNLHTADCEDRMISSSSVGLPEDDVMEAAPSLLTLASLQPFLNRFQRLSWISLLTRLRTDIRSGYAHAGP